MPTTTDIVCFHSKIVKYVNVATVWIESCEEFSNLVIELLSYLTPLTILCLYSTDNLEWLYWQCYKAILKFWIIKYAQEPLYVFFDENHCVRTN